MKLGNNADNFVRENAPFIRQAIEAGGSLRKAAGILNQRGIKTSQNNTWRHSSVKRAVNRMKALGLYPWSEEEIVSSIDIMGFEPAVAYNVPEFGNVHVLMKDGEPWVIGTELGRILNSKKNINWLNSYINYHKEIKKLCITLSSDAAHCLIFNRAVQPVGLLIYSYLAIKECAKKLRSWEAQKLDKLLVWMQNNFGISYSDGKLLPLVKYRKLEVVFFQHKILVTVRSLNICLGRISSCGNATGCPSVRIKKLLVLLKKADALALGLYGTRAVRVCMTIDGAKEYLKTSCRSPNSGTVLAWIEREVEPAARKHLAALEAQEAKETKEMPEETPMLPSTETVSPAPAVPTYEDLLAPWRAALKVQEDTLKELEAVKADLASRAARIDEQNADIKTLVENNNAFQDERRKLKEAAEAKEKEIESLKNRIIELEDTVAYQNGQLSENAAKVKEYAELHEIVTNFMAIHMGNEREDLEGYANVRSLCATFENWWSTYEFEDLRQWKERNLLKEMVEEVKPLLGVLYPDIDYDSESIESHNYFLKGIKALRAFVEEQGSLINSYGQEITKLNEALNAKDAELAKFKAFKDMMQSFMQEESANSPVEAGTTQSESDVPSGWVEIAPGVKCTGLF